MTTLDEARAALTQARSAYRRDMLWLRRRYGIIPAPEAHLTNGVLLAALDAIEKNDVASVEKAVQSFDTLHQDILARIAWDLIEHTKNSLKDTRHRQPELFEAKLKLWKQASWAFTTARFRLVTAKYREAIRVATRI